MREGIRYDWIIAVSNSADRNGVKILKTCGKVNTKSHRSRYSLYPIALKKLKISVKR